MVNGTHLCRIQKVEWVHGLFVSRKPRALAILNGIDKLLDTPFAHVVFAIGDQARHGKIVFDVREGESAGQVTRRSSRLKGIGGGNILTVAIIIFKKY